MTSAEAAKRLAQFGPNRIYRSHPISFIGIARHEVMEPMILLLLVVGILYSVWGRIEDAVTIFLVISILVSAEVYNEYRAKKAIASLAQAAAPKARTIRDGRLSEIDAEDVVPEDHLVLIQGTRIAADSRIVKSASLQTDESSSGRSGRSRFFFWLYFCPLSAQDSILFQSAFIRCWR